MRFSIFFFCLLVFKPCVAGGPWLLSKKSGFLQFQSTFPSGGYDRLFLRNGGESLLNSTVSDYTIQAYLEYGLFDNLNITAIVPYKYLLTTSKNEFPNNTVSPGTLHGFSNIFISMKYPLVNKKLKMAISVQSNLKTIKKEIKKGLVTGYDGNSIGTTIHLGMSLFSNWYSFIDLSYQNWSNNFSDIVLFHYELGYQVKPRIWTAITLDIRESVENGAFLNENLRLTGLYTNDQEYFSYGVKGSYETKKGIGLNIATFGAFSGNFVAKIPTFSVGVYKKW